MSIHPQDEANQALIADLAATLHLDTGLAQILNLEKTTEETAT